jgi:hypothetical protein
VRELNPRRVTPPFLLQESKAEQLARDPNSPAIHERSSPATA